MRPYSILIPSSSILPFCRDNFRHLIGHLWSDFISPAWCADELCALCNYKLAPQSAKTLPLLFSKGSRRWSNFAHSLTRNWFVDYSHRDDEAALSALNAEGVRFKSRSLLPPRQLAPLWPSPADTYLASSTFSLARTLSADRWARSPAPPPRQTDVADLFSATHAERESPNSKGESKLGELFLDKGASVELEYVCSCEYVWVFKRVCVCVWVCLCECYFRQEKHVINRKQVHSLATLWGTPCEYWIPSISVPVAFPWPLTAHSDLWPLTSTRAARLAPTTVFQTTFKIIEIPLLSFPILTLWPSRPPRLRDQPSWWAAAIRLAD